MKKKPYLKKNEVYLLSPNFKRRKWCELYDMNLNFCEHFSEVGTTERYIPHRKRCKHHEFY
jgi:hypothetical protein